MKNFLESKQHAKEYIDDRVKHWYQKTGNSYDNKDMYGQTSFDQSHQHDYEINETGDGNTVSTYPKDYNIPHEHKIEKFVVAQASDGHVHFIHEGNMGYTLPESRLKEKDKTEIKIVDKKSGKVKKTLSIKDFTKLVKGLDSKKPLGDFIKKYEKENPNDKVEISSKEE
jgi:hypothetical protein